MPNVPDDRNLTPVDGFDGLRVVGLGAVGAAHRERRDGAVVELGACRRSASSASGSATRRLVRAMMGCVVHRWIGYRSERRIGGIS